MWKNRIIVILTITLLVCYNTNGQNKWKPSDYSKLTINNFRENKLFQETIDFNNIDFARLNAAIFYVTNEVRDKKRLPVLEYSPYLEKSATIHSEDMVKYHFFSHINTMNKKHKEPADRGRLAGIINPLMAENIITSNGINLDKKNKEVYPRGEGRFSYTPDGPIIENHTYISLADNMLEDWMNSKGHRENILSKDALQLGCGTAFFINDKFPFFMATQNFQQYKKIETK